MKFNMTKLIKWLESENGRYVQIFGSGTSEDVAEAYEYGQKMRANIGESSVVTVEISYNKVVLSLSLTPVNK